MFCECGVKPILAVVPDNHDPTLVVGPPKADFWAQVRRWQSRGWTIALHGYQHCYVTRDRGVMKLNAYSEFAGTSADSQMRRLTAARQIFLREGIATEVWVAPGHSFDLLTVSILKELGVLCISDGYSLYPSCDRYGVLWVPQQIGRFRWAPLGVWTVCIHFNRWTRTDIERFRKDLHNYQQRLTFISEVQAAYMRREPSPVDLVLQRWGAYAARLKRRLVRFRHPLGIRWRHVAHE